LDADMDDDDNFVDDSTDSEESDLSSESSE